MKKISKINIIKKSIDDNLFNQLSIEFNIDIDTIKILDKFLGRKSLVDALIIYTDNKSISNQKRLKIIEENKHIESFPFKFLTCSEIFFDQSFNEILGLSYMGDYCIN